MKHHIWGTLLCLLPAALSFADSYNPAALRDIARTYQNTHLAKTQPTTMDVCGQIKQAVNSNPSFIRANLRINCVRRPGSVVLAMPNFSRFSPNAVPTGVIDLWLQTIYEAARENRVAKLNLFLSDRLNADSGIMLSAEPQNGRRGVFTDWTKVNLGGTEVTDAEPAPAADTSANVNTKTEPPLEQPQAVPQEQSPVLQPTPQSTYRPAVQPSSTTNPILDTALPPPPPMR